MLKAVTLVCIRSVQFLQVDLSGTAVSCMQTTSRVLNAMDILSVCELNHCLASYSCFTRRRKYREIPICNQRLITRGYFVWILGWSYTVRGGEGWGTAWGAYFRGSVSTLNWITFRTSHPAVQRDDANDESYLVIPQTTIRKGG